jgi:DNA-binding IclR family transcriptional regulator
MEAAKEAEAQIIELLRTRAMGPGALAEATGANLKTAADRLRRLRARGLVEAAEGGGWRAS